MANKKLNVGGQAVIEGVMIRGPSKYSIAVRKGKKIISKNGTIPKKKHKFLQWPIVRGFINLVEMLIIGIKALMWSAEQAGDEDEKLGKKELTFTLLLSIGLVIVFFIALPYFLTSLIGFVEEQKPILFNLVDGVIRILIFIIYVVAISFMQDVKILFQYHGAEHKAIHCYEKGKKLNIANVKKFTTLHPRCGTAFLMIVMVVSILVFSILPSLILFYFPDFLNLNVWIRRGILFPVRILLIPLIAGISYEILKISDKKQGNLLFRLISMPGLALQKITTQEPNKKQIEVAIYSLKNLLKIEKIKK
jgi:uncharacterized protein YqhQ|tara:strand:- start:28358 stop:29275 length:918 start_codon:yes stop_codon:yes gene_type:complete